MARGPALPAGPHAGPAGRLRFARSRRERCQGGQLAFRICQSLDKLSWQRGQVLEEVSTPSPASPAWRGQDVSARGAPGWLCPPCPAPMGRAVVGTAGALGLASGLELELRSGRGQ